MAQRQNWEGAILDTFALEKFKGIVTLDDLYDEVPALIAGSRASDFAHTIRGYLTRLKSKGRIKQIGLSTYALIDTPVDSLYEDVINETTSYDDFLSLPRERLHGYLEGMLVEIGNLNDYATYTPDKNVVFNGKKLSELVTHEQIPNFTYSEHLGKIANIDVIWFSENYPSQAFDVETSTDFTKALLRCYELRHFRTEIFMVADDKKKNIFDNRLSVAPFEKVRRYVKFASIQSVFDDYKNAVRHDKSKARSQIL